MGFGLAPSAQTTEGLMAHGWILPAYWAWAFSAPASVPWPLLLGSGLAPCSLWLLGLCCSALGLLLASFGCLASALGSGLAPCSHWLPWPLLLGFGPAPCSLWLLGLCAWFWACSLLPLAVWPLLLGFGPAPCSHWLLGLFGSAWWLRLLFACFFVSLVLRLVSGFVLRA